MGGVKNACSISEEGPSLLPKVKIIYNIKSIQQTHLKIIHTY